MYWFVMIVYSLFVYILVFAFPVFLLYLPCLYMRICRARPPQYLNRYLHPRKNASMQISLRYFDETRLSGLSKYFR